MVCGPAGAGPNPAPRAPSPRGEMVRDGGGVGSEGGACRWPAASSRAGYEFDGRNETWAAEGVVRSTSAVAGAAMGRNLIDRVRRRESQDLDRRRRQASERSCRGPVPCRGGPIREESSIVAIAGGDSRGRKRQVAVLPTGRRAGKRGPPGVCDASPDATRGAGTTGIGAMRIGGQTASPPRVVSSCGALLGR